MAIIATSARRETLVGAYASSEEEGKALDDRLYRGHGVRTDEEGEGGDGRRY